MDINRHKESADNGEMETGTGKQVVPECHLVEC